MSSSLFLYNRARHATYKAITVAIACAEQVFVELYRTESFERSVLPALLFSNIVKTNKQKRKREAAAAAGLN